jgi:hypothetical protein
VENVHSLPEKMMPDKQAAMPVVSFLYKMSLKKRRRIVARHHEPGGNFRFTLLPQLASAFAQA